MAITILPPVVEDASFAQIDSDHDSMSVDSDGGVELEDDSRPSKRPRTAGRTDIGAGIVIPGEVVTDDPQWMRLVCLKLLVIHQMRRVIHSDNLQEAMVPTRTPCRHRLSPLLPVAFKKPTSCFLSSPCALGIPRKLVI